METKKTKGADLESRRMTRILLGLAAVFSTTFVCMEINLSEGDPQVSEKMLEEMMKEMKLHRKEQEYTPVVALPKPKKKEERKAVDIVDEPAEVLQPDITDEKPQKAKDGADEAIAPIPVEKALHEDAKAPTLGPAEKGKTPDLRVLQKLPEFPGGMSEFVKWLTKNLVYPPAAQQRKIEGKVVVSFIVEADGSVTNMKLVNKVNSLLDREALRVLGNMPKWKAGIHDGKPCRTMIAVPVEFKL